MKKPLLIMTLFVLAVCSAGVPRIVVAGQAQGQTRIVSGKVTGSDDGLPLPQVSVLLKGTTTGVPTNMDGEYRISVPETGGTLVFRYLGYVVQETEIGNRSVIDVVLKPDATQLDEVVVTALGIERQAKSIGYATQKVDSKSLNNVVAPDLASKLNAKVAGLQINTSSTIGGSSRIVLRGETSLGLGGNEALIVVNGVPINSPGANTGSIDWGNGFADLNSNDIESIDVLKGPAAAALYGSRAGNGVILITTKKGSDGKAFQIDYNSSIMFESLLAYPDTYQYEYAVGEGDGRLLYDPETGKYNPNPRDETWATEKNDPTRKIEWWFSPTANGFRAGDTFLKDKGATQKLPYVSTGKNNYKEFFQTGHALYNQIAISSSNERTSSRFSFEDLNQTGFQPGTDLKRQSIAVSFNFKVAERLTVDFSLNNARTNSDNRPRNHWGSFSVNYVLQWMMPGNHFDQLKNYWQTSLQGRKQINWRAGHNNPYFLANEVKAGQSRNRLFGNINVNYKITDDISFLVRHGDDFTFEKRTNRNGFGAVAGLPNISVQDIKLRESNTDFLLRANKSLGKDFEIETSFGGNVRNTTSETLSGSAWSLTLPGLYTLNNASQAFANQNESRLRVYSLYAMANIAYKKGVYLTLTGRNDWSSTLPVKNNSFFYPSASLSVVLSDLLELPNWINFLKIRPNISWVGKDTGPHRLQNVFSRGGFQVYSHPGSLTNENLKPEITNAYGIGVESKFLKGRLGLEVSYYNQTSRNQIISATLPPSSGYGSRLINAGEIQNSGIEITFRATPVETQNLRWNATANFSANRNKVVSLGAGLNQYQIARYGDSGELILARVGMPLLGIYGFKPLTVEDPTSPYFGQQVYSQSGTPLRKSEMEYIGNSNPDFILGITNNFSYKNLNLNVVVDIREGGYTYSQATNIMYGGGFNKETADWRTNGVGGKGVIRQANGSYVPNKIILKGDDIKRQFITAWRDISTNNIFTSSFVKIREVNLSYNFPKKLMQKMPLDRLSIALVGRNLFVWDSVPNQDADSFGGGLPGYTGTYTYPTSRNYGVTLTARF